MLPHPALRTFISNYTISFPCLGLLSEQYAIMPHGSATLVFACDEHKISGNLFGPITKSASVGQSANSVPLLFIVEFQPGGYYGFHKHPQKELTNLVFSFDAVSSPLHRQIAQKLETANCIGNLISEIDKIFLEQLKINCCQQEFSAAKQLIINNCGQLTVKEISQDTFYSERHLNRLFDQQIGMNVKSFSRLVRINKALQLLQRPSLSILQICQQTGFYDTAHFMHDFKSICGITPLEYRKNMSDFYNQIAKF